MAATVFTVTDAMVHAALKVQHPVAYQSNLRDPSDGSLPCVRVEQEIAMARAMIEAALSASVVGGSSSEATSTQSPSNQAGSASSSQNTVAWCSDTSGQWLTVVYRNVAPGDEAREICDHPKLSAMSWSHALDDRDAARFAAEKNLATAPAQPPEGLSPAARDVMAERARQLKGFSVEQDDRYTGCELAAAAATYAMCTAPAQLQCMGVRVWPWPSHQWHCGTYRQNLTKAGALILAEIERIDRRDGAPRYTHQVSAFHAPLTLAELLEVRRAVGELVGTDRTSVAVPLLARAVQEGYLACDWFSAADVEALDRAIEAAQSGKPQ